jgi:hypothetical protein
MAFFAMSRVSSRSLPSVTKPGNTGTVTVSPPCSLASKKAKFKMAFRFSGGADFSCGAGDGKGADSAEREDARAGSFWQARDPDEEGQERDVAEGDAVAGGGERFEQCSVNAKSGSEMLCEIIGGIASNFDRGELPHS